MARKAKIPTAQFFVVSYQVIGSDCQGQYLVRAHTKTEANSIVKSFDDDYARVWSQNEKEYVEDMSQDDWNEMLEDNKDKVVNVGDAESLWSGT